MRIITLSILFSLMFMTGCQTPNPAMPRHLLSNPGETVYETTIYSYQELLCKFYVTNYISLSSIYVSTTGSDTSGNGTVSAPYATIQHAVDLARAGNIIRVKAGTYSESVFIRSSGASNQPIVLYSEDGPGAAIIDANGEYGGIQTTQSYNVIDGFEIKNVSAYGVGVYSGENLSGNLSEEEVSGKYNVVRNCTIHDTGREGIKGAGNRYYLIENNFIYGPTGEEGVDCVASYHVIIRNNTFSNCTTGAAYCKGGSANVYYNANLIIDQPIQQYGIILGGWSDLLSVFRGTIPEKIPEAYEQVAMNNVFVNVARCPIYIVSAEKVSILNNTFYQCGYNESDGIIGFPGEYGSSHIHKPTTNVMIYNNLVYNDESNPLNRFLKIWHPDDHYGLNIGYNTIQPANSDFEWGYTGNPGNNDEQVTNIMFTDAGVLDFSLLSNSSGTDNATNISIINIDYTGQSRNSNVTDRGAYEN